MKRMIVGIVAGLVLGTASTAGAVSAMTNDIHYGGIWCKTAYAGGARSVMCIREGGSGYGVGINNNLAMMMNLDSGKIVAQRVQP